MFGGRPLCERRESEGHSFSRNGSVTLGWVKPITNLDDGPKFSQAMGRYIEAMLWSMYVDDGNLVVLAAV